MDREVLKNRPPLSKTGVLLVSDEIHHRSCLTTVIPAFNTVDPLKISA